MFGIPSLSLSQLFLLFGIVAAIMAYRRSGKFRLIGPTLVLRRFHISKNPVEGIYVEIVGRASGITQWVLTMLGLDTETTLKVMTDRIEKKMSSLSNQDFQIVPMWQISTTFCGYFKPFWALVVGGAYVGSAGISILSNILEASKTNYSANSTIVSFNDFLSILIGIAFVAGYHFSQKLYIVVEAGGTTSLGISFKRSVFENVSIDIRQALQVISLINEQVIGNGANGVESLSSQVNNNAANISAKTTPITGQKSLEMNHCPQCSAQLAEHSAFCEECGQQILCQ